MPVFSLKKMEDYVSAITTNREAKYLVCTCGDGSLTTFNIPGKKLHVQVSANIILYFIYNYLYNCLLLVRRVSRRINMSWFIQIWNKNLSRYK